MKKWKRAQLKAQAAAAAAQIATDALRPVLVTAGFIAFIVIALVALWYAPVAVNQNVEDIGVYQRIADNVTNSPEQINAEYPPLMSVVFWGLRLVAPQAAFADSWVVFVILGIIATTLYTFFAFGAAAELFPIGVVLSILVLGPEVVLARYDILVLMLLFIAWTAFARKHFFASGFWIVIAAGVKLVPALLFPIMLIMVPRGEWKPLIKGALAGFAGMAFICLGILGWKGTVSNIVYMTTYHSERGFEVESTLSSADLVLHNLEGEQGTLSFHHAAWHNGDLGRVASLLSVIVLVAGSLLIYWFLWHNRMYANGLLAEYWLVQLLWIIVAAPVLSPQYLVWIVPLIVIWAFDRLSARQATKATWRIAAVALAVGIVTQWIFPYHFADLIQQTAPLATYMLAVRNAALLVLICLIASAIRAKQRTVRASTDQGQAGGDS